MAQRSRATLALGRALHEIRTSAGMSQERLALESGVNRNTVGKIERAQMSPTWDMMVKLAGALEIDPTRLAELAVEHGALGD